MNENERIKAVRDMQLYINEHMSKEITLSQMAKVVGYSPWYCVRIFKEQLGKTPFEYIRLRRLTEAAKVLKDGNEKVIDVAFDFYFQSQEGFTRAFSKTFGISPKQYALKKPPIKWFISYPVSPRNIDSKGEWNMSDMKTTTVFTQVIDKPERKLLLKRGIEAREYFTYCDEVGCDIWGILCSVNEAVGEPMGLWLPKNLIKAGTSEYVQGVEVPMNYKGELPEGFEVIVLPPCKMMIFQGNPYEDENFEEEIMIIKNAISKYNPEIYGFSWADEDGPSFQYEPLGDRGYIEGRPVRSM